jgi:hypothetical protein
MTLRLPDITFQVTISSLQIKWCSVIEIFSTFHVWRASQHVNLPRIIVKMTFVAQNRIIDWANQSRFRDHHSRASHQRGQSRTSPDSSNGYCYKNDNQGPRALHAKYQYFVVAACSSYFVKVSQVSVPLKVALLPVNGNKLWPFIFLYGNNPWSVTTPVVYWKQESITFNRLTHDLLFSLCFLCNCIIVWWSNCCFVVMETLLPSGLPENGSFCSRCHEDLRKMAMKTLMLYS